MKEKLFIGVFWLGTAKIIINCLALISTIVLARLLTPEDFGLVAIVLALLAIIEAVTDLSLASALIHLKSLTEYHFHTAWSLNFVRGLIMAAIFASASSMIADYYDDPRLVNIMLIISLSIMVSGLTNPKIVVLTKSLVFWQEFAVTVSQKLMAVVVSIFVAIYFRSYWALVAGVITSQVIGVLVSYLIIPYKPKFSFVHIRDIWSFSIWLTLGKIVNTLNWKFDQLVIGSYLGNKTLGFYAVGDNLAGMPTREAIQPLENTLFPGFSHIAHDKNRLRAAYVKAQSLITAIALPLGIGFALVAQSLIPLVMGEKWQPAIQVVEIIAGVYVLQTIGSQAQPLAMALGYTKAIFKRDLAMFIIRLPVIILSLIYFGLFGLLIGRVFTGTLSLIINMFLIQHMLALNVIAQLKNNIRSIMSVLVMSASVLLFNYAFKIPDLLTVLVLNIAIGGLIYISSHTLIWLLMNKPLGPETELLNLINKRFKKSQTQA
jgi:PST family polysaccharide transporter